jgi:hypothetical protein
MLTVIVPLIENKAWSSFPHVAIIGTGRQEEQLVKR